MNQEFLAPADGSRLNHREYDKSEIEKKKIELEAQMKKTQTTHIRDKFGGSSADILEQEFVNSTIGLVSMEEFKRKREQIDSLVLEGYKKKLEENKDIKKTKDANQKAKIKKSVLSFEHEDDDEEKPKEEDKDKDINKKLQQDQTNASNLGKRKNESISDKILAATEETNSSENEPGNKIVKKKYFGKNPNVNTSFLPDKDRDEKLNEVKKKLIDEYIKHQEIIKNQIIQVYYSYWDGSNIVKSCKVKKDTKIFVFLEICRKELARDYSDLRSTSGEGLMLILQEFIIPNSMTFYELSLLKVEGRKGLIFEDRKKDDDNVYETINPPAKIIDRRWYERNKHIYPCSIWETLDPAKYEAKKP